MNQIFSYFANNLKISNMSEFNNQTNGMHEEERTFILDQSLSNQYITPNQISEANRASPQKSFSNYLKKHIDDSEHLSQEEDENTHFDKEKFEEMHTLIDQFDDLAYTLKKQITKMQKVSQAGNSFPQTLRICYAAIKRLLESDDASFDQNEQIGDAINRQINLTFLTQGAFEKFKVEFFTITTQVSNKDMMTLKIQSVKNNLQKLQAIQHKIEQMEESVLGSSNEEIKVAKRYIQFEHSIFLIKHQEAKQIDKQQLDVLETNKLTQSQTQAIIQECKDLSKTIVPFTATQRKELAEINTGLNRCSTQHNRLKTQMKAVVSERIGAEMLAKESGEAVGAYQEQVEIREMVQQSRTLEAPLEYLRMMQKMQVRVAALETETQSNYEVAKSILDRLLNFSKSLQSGIIDEYNKIKQQILHLSAQLTTALETQTSKLNSFESRITTLSISDADNFFINKELTKLRGQVSTIEMPIEQSLSLVQTIDPSKVSTEELENAKQGLEHLQKLEQIDTPKLIQNIESLDQFVIKALRNQLNEDNKKSQAKIAVMKKQYDELQKKIEAVNNKYGDCRTLIDTFDESFDTEDFERLQEIQQIDDLLNEEEINIYGSQENPKHESLQGIKKTVIVAINDLVSQFNDNNKLIKEQNKSIKNEEQTLSDLILRNQAIQKNCKQISDKVSQGSQLADGISDRLDLVINQKIVDELSAKYNQKMKNIQNCDDKMVKNQQQVDKLLVLIAKQLDVTSELSKKLESVNPLNMGQNENNQEFNQQITQKLEEVTQLQDDFNLWKVKITKYQESQNKIAEPIGILHEREVTNSEVEGILRNLNEIEAEIKKIEDLISQNNVKTTKIQKGTKAIIENEVARKLTIGMTNLDEIEKMADTCIEKNTQTSKKLKYYKQTIDKAKSNQGKNDPVLDEKLNELVDELYLFDNDLKEYETKMRDLKKKRSDLKKTFEEIDKAPEKFTTHQLDNVLHNLDDLQVKVNDTEDKLKSTESKIAKKLQDLEKLLESSNSKKEILTDIEDLNQELDADLAKLDDILSKLPVTVTNIKVTLKEIQVDLEDFQEQKDQINENLDELNDIEDDIQKMQESAKVYSENKKKVRAGLKNAQNMEQLKKVLDQLQNYKNNVTNIFTDALDTQDQLIDMIKDNGDCNLSTAIDKRKNELVQLTTRITRLQSDFNNAKKSASSNSDDVNQKLKEIEFKLKAHDQNKLKLQKAIQQEFDTLKPLDLEDFSKNHIYVKKVREYKRQLAEAEANLRDIEDLQKDVVKNLTELDMENSVDLMNHKANQLREQLLEAQSNLKNVSRSGAEMEGNTSNGEEEELIEGIKNELPDVFDNIQNTLKSIQEIDALVSDLKKGGISPEKMDQLQELVSSVQENVEESETLANKLEKELLEWNAQKKLARRDTELEEIQNLCSEFIEDLNQEKTNTEIELEKNLEKQEENKDQEMVDKDGNPVDIMQDLTRLETQMGSYIQEINVLLEDVRKLDDLYLVCFEEFNPELPKAVLDMRKQRQSNAQKQSTKNLKRPAQFLKPSKSKSLLAPQDDKKMSVYEMISLNCKFKKRIQNMLKDLKAINKKRKSLEDNYSDMRKEVFKIQNIKLYKPVRGDAVDEMFADHLNKAKLAIEVQRISASNYMFGTKKILAKIINGNLVIRVGGGYMNAEEFIEQYGKIEMMKMMKYEENKNELAVPNSSSGVRNSLKPPSNANVTLASDIKQKMQNHLRQTLLNVKTYEGHQTLNKSKVKEYGVATDGVQDRLQSALDGMRETFKKKLDLEITIDEDNMSARGSFAGGAMTPSGRVSPNRPRGSINVDSKEGFFTTAATPKKFVAGPSRIGVGVHSRRGTMAPDQLETLIKTPTTQKKIIGTKK